MTTTAPALPPRQINLVAFVDLYCHLRPTLDGTTHSPKTLGRAYAHAASLDDEDLAWQVERMADAIQYESS